ncbi:diguanylate cyclase (GGDEF) domain-containing protein [Methylophilus rhizosphaerae]|uniref:Diguanylate cyclase (GGDEF) domain-containing protein n=1 Tax=Methylophilus rhizosphaerae TaxID=492660 RepID=A0A1G9EVV6_9PROT|nr:bifunctional diguanylate cyclase/phosphodiesterase [Methylophilus rhizosphaerae]SDK80231.1 diguanylate cyclase (GGDEF) domain-containing protein [Methylophilus rhizosphaerae]
MTLSRKVIVVAVSVLLICLLASLKATPETALWLDNIHWISTISACLILAILGYFRANPAHRTCKRWFVAGAFAYFTGGVLWIFQLLTSQTAFPAQSDIFYPLLGPCLMIGFITALRSQLSRSKAWAFTIDALSFSIAVLGYVLISYLPKSADVSLLQLAVLTAYPASMLSAALVSLLLIPYLRPAWMMPWLLLSAGLTLLGICWMQWNLNALNHSPQSSLWINYGFSVADLLIGSGLYGWQVRITKRTAFHRQCRRLRSWIPVIAFVFSISTLMLIWWQSGPHHYAYHIAIASVTSILIFSAVRQSILLRESERLLRAEKRLAEKELEYHKLSHSDPLTHLPNRLAILNLLEHAIINAASDSGMVALLMIDLKHFQNINDSFGHHTGDLFLLEVAQRLQYITHECGELGRVHGDKFALIVTRHKTDAELVQLAHNLCKIVHKPVLVENHELILDACIGISLYPRDASNADQLARNANTALAHAKRTTQQLFVFYCKEQTKLAQSRFRLDVQLRKAIKKQEFFLQFQPIFSLDKQAQPRVVKIEALIRWRNHKGDIVSPAEFIPYAEQSGLILPIGEWVISDAFRHLAALMHQNDQTLGLSINISPRQFRDHSLPLRIAQHLKQYAIPPRCITLEITESAVFEHEEQALEILKQLKTLGVRVSLDDFGVGNSSLFKLKHLPIDELKIDRAFMVDVPDSSADSEIVSTIVKTAGILGISVVVEGIETQAQLDFLRDTGCDCIQGFLLGRPMPIEDIRALLSIEQKQSAESAPTTEFLM